MLPWLWYRPINSVSSKCFDDSVVMLSRVEWVSRDKTRLCTACRLITFSYKFKFLYLFTGNLTVFSEKSGIVHRRKRFSKWFPQNVPILLYSLEVFACGLICVFLLLVKFIFLLFFLFWLPLYGEIKICILVPKYLQILPWESLDIAPNILNDTLFRVNAYNCWVYCACFNTVELNGRPKHFDFS